jgi:hypothetical protein
MDWTIHLSIICLVPMYSAASITEENRRIEQITYNISLVIGVLCL